MDVVIVEYIIQNHETNLSSSLKLRQRPPGPEPEYYMNCNKSSFEAEMNAVSMKPSIV